jgi:hypothetical protein
MFTLTLTMHNAQHETSHHTPQRDTTQHNTTQHNTTQQHNRHTLTHTCTGASLCQDDAQRYEHCAHCARGQGDDSSITLRQNRCFVIGVDSVVWDVRICLCGFRSFGEVLRSGLLLLGVARHQEVAVKVKIALFNHIQTSPPSLSPHLSSNRRAL